MPRRPQHLTIALQLLAEGMTDGDEIQRRIAQDCGLDPAATPRSTNNHAWALVGLQQEDFDPEAQPLGR